MERTEFEQWKGREVARLLALLETERRYYQEMVAALPVALVVLSGERLVVSANRAFRATFGVKAEDLRRKSIEQILPSERLVEKIRQVHVSGAAQPGFLIEANQKLWRIAIVPIRNWDDEMEMETLLAAVDVTDVRLEPSASTAAPESPATAPVETPAKESAPKETAAEAAAAVKPAPVEQVAARHLPGAMWRAEASTLQVVSVSGAPEALLGYTAEDWTQAPQFLVERIHPEDRASVMEVYQAAIEKGDVQAGAEFRAVSASGNWVWVQESIRVAEGFVTGVMVQTSDRKQLERQKVAAERAGALRDLSARLAHDLNNPLMIITGYAEEMLLGLDPKDPRRHDMEQILDATRRIAGFTGQLLQYTRRGAETPVSVNVAAILSGMRDRIAAEAGENVPVEVRCAQPVWALADAEQLEEVILALISPGREDVQGRSAITIACDHAVIAQRLEAPALPAGEWARITVTQDGRGMTEQQRVALFESFLVKDPEKSEARALALAYAVVREWGGDIAVKSEPSEGSVFTVYLPVGQPREQEPPKREAPRPVMIEEPEPEVFRETVLVLDDEPGIRALLAKILRRERYQVLEAGSADEAFSAAARHRGAIDLLLTDVLLPESSGREVAERLTEARPGLKVLYISGFTSDEAIHRGEFPPGAKFLQKPFTLGALVGKVREAIER